MRSPSGADDLYDYMAVQLMSSGMDGPPLVMVIISSRESYFYMFHEP